MLPQYFQAGCLGTDLAGAKSRKAGMLWQSSLLKLCTWCAQYLNDSRCQVLDLQQYCQSACSTHGTCSPALQVVCGRWPSKGPGGGVNLRQGAQRRRCQDRKAGRALREREQEQEEAALTAPRHHAARGGARPSPPESLLPLHSARLLMLATTSPGCGPPVLTAQRASTQCTPLYAGTQSR